MGSRVVETRLVARTAGGIVVVMALVSLLTGARTSVLPMKLYPAVKFATALAFLSATLLEARPPRPSDWHCGLHWPGAPMSHSALTGRIHAG